MSFLSRLAAVLKSEARLIRTIFDAMLQFVAALFGLLLGKIQWQPPVWVAPLGRMGKSQLDKARRHPRQVAAGAAILVLVVVGTLFGKWWYDRIPKPVEVQFSFSLPGRARIEVKDAKPDPVRVQFSQSVAPLKFVGKEVSVGVELKPKTEGRWTWESDRTLLFDPARNWPIGTEFSVTFSPKGLVADHVRLADYGFRFRTEAFSASITKAEFYQDPVNPNLRKVVLTVTFSHPVNTREFERRVAMELRAATVGMLGVSTERLKFVVSYDKLKLNANVHSQPLSIPAKDATVGIVIAAGVRPEDEGEATADKLGRDVPVPGLYSMRVGKAQLMLVNNERFEPEQVLAIEMSAAVHEKDLRERIAAFVLPLYHPETTEEARKQPYRWSDPAKIGPEILKLAEPLKLEGIPAEREYSELQSFKYQADVGRFILVKISKGLKSFGGYQMGGDYDEIVQVRPYPRELRILHSGSVLALSGERKVSVFSRDVPAMQVEVGRVVAGQLQHLVTQSSGPYGRPQFGYGQFNESNLTERFTKVVELPRLAPGRPHYQPVDLDEYLEAGAGGRRGVFLLKVTAYDPAAKRTTGNHDYRLVVVTDLGILVKRAADGSQDVFVQSIHTGDPVAGATVEVVGKNGLAVMTQTTDAAGRTRFPALQEFRNEQVPTLYVAHRSGDLSFLPLERGDRVLDLSRFDVGGVTSGARADAMSAYLFSDRGIYRPGDEFRIGMIVKAVDWSKSVAGLPLQIEVTDPRGLVIKRERIKLSAAGFEDLRYSTQETSPTGTYNVALYIVKDGHPGGQLGATSVTVQEFQPDRMKMTAHMSAEAVEGWVSPVDLKTIVNLQNLFGTPASDRRVQAMLTLSPSYPVFQKYGDYLFYDPQRAKEGFNERLQDGKTDSKGEAEFDLNLGRFAAATYRVHVVAQGFEAEGGRSVAAEAATVVSSMPYLVGYKADGDLAYIKRDSGRNIEFIAIDPKARKTTVDGLTISRIERKYVSVLARQGDGTYRYESRKKEISLEEAPFKIAANGVRNALITAQPGDFALLVRDKQGLELARVDYSVTGQANLTRSLERNAELQVVLNKRDYAPGEEIELQIRAPYTGAGLITIERERVYQHAWFRTTTTNSVQRIRLPQGLEGNGYVSVAFVRDPGSDEIYSSPLSYGVVPFSVSLDRRRTEIELKAADLGKPGDTLKLRYRTDQPSRIVIFAVDEGILQVANYKAADPLGHFFQKRALEVRTSQILDLILPEFKRLLAASAPGGDAQGALGRNLNPFKRRRDKPVAFWSGILEAGPQTREIHYTVPDYFNGTLRVMAVAVSENSVGTFQKKITVRADFVLSPNAPTAVAPGDEFDVSVGVANNVAGSGASPTIAVSVTPSLHLEIVGAPKVDLQIAEMRESSAVFRIRVKDKLGSASLAFQAQGAGKSAKISVDTSVRPPIPYMTRLSVGHMKGSNVDVPVSRQMYAEFRTQRASISRLPLGIAHGLVGYLGGFSYSCTEQLVSQGIPALILGDRPEFGYVKLQDGKSLDALLAVLRSRQNAEGAYGLWAANQHVSAFVSVYAQHFLIEAKERGQGVPQDMIAAGNTYLQQLSANDSDDLAADRLRAYAVYLLTRQGIVTSNLATAVQQRLEARLQKNWRKDLGAAYLAASYSLMKQDKLAESILDGAKFSNGVGTFRHYYDDLVHDSVLLYLLSKHFPRRLKDLPTQTLVDIVERVKNGNYNTLSSAYTLLALDAYSKAATDATSGKLEIAEILRDGKLRALQLPAGLAPHVDFSADAAKLRFTSEGDLSAFYSMEESGFDKVQPAKEVKDGLEVLREYTGVDGKPIVRAKLGEEIEVHLKVRTIGRDHVSDLALVDLLPGGFEVVIEPRSQPDVTTSVRRPAPAYRRNEEGREPEDSESDGGGAEGDDSEPEHYAQDSADASTGAPEARLPIGTSKSTWQPEYADVREDRVVLYGSIGSNISEFVYRIKATNAGNYQVPPAFGESMYDRSVRALSLSGKFSVDK